MKHKHTHYIYASFAFLLFVALGYMVKFYPEALTGFDSNIQTWVRGGLPAGLTRFFKTITMLGNTPVQAIIAIVAVIWLYLRQYKSEAIFVGASVLTWNSGKHSKQRTSFRYWLLPTTVLVVC